MLSVVNKRIMLNVIMLSVFMLNAVMLIVMAPSEQHFDIVNVLKNFFLRH